MKILIVTVCVLAALFGITETLKCFVCGIPKGIAKEECERTTTEEICGPGVTSCLHRVVDYRNITTNRTVVYWLNMCFDPQQCKDICKQEVKRDGYETLNCTSNCCTNGDLCNGILMTTIAVPTTIVSTTAEPVIRTTDASSPTLGNTQACPTTSCGQQCLYLNIFNIALVLLASLVQVNCC